MSLAKNVRDVLKCLLLQISAGFAVKSLQSCRGLVPKQQKIRNMEIYSEGSIPGGLIQSYLDTFIYNLTILQ